MHPSVRRLFPAALGLALASFVACSGSSTATTTGGDPDAGSDAGSSGDADGSVSEAALPSLLPGCTQDPGATPPSFDPKSAADPIGEGKLTLAMALAGFPSGGGTLTAAIATEKGVIKCTLDEAAAPISVANFVGLARGTRPYKTTGDWQVGRFYDGLVWHRVIPGFVIQGGDPEGSGFGGPGFDLPDENHVDEPLGTLAMAASSKASGSQFYIVVGTGPAADYNVFGTCETATAIAVAASPRDANDKPLTSVHMLRVEIGRCP
ncbi:MAG: Peptidyl-prolyl cis-trans isomerase [Labilithrix sp.]|nr:Peptidyl-prolyl cis-trans isomerase [Labilithrix sp.]